MADNIAAKSDASTTVGTLASDEIGGIHYIKNKLVYGADDSATDVTTSAGFPVAQQGTWTVDLGATDNAVLDAIVSALGGTLTVDGSGVTQPVSGTVTANLSAIDNAVLDAIAASVAGTLTVDGSGVTQPVSIAGTVTVDLGVNNDVTLATLPDTSAGDLAAINAALAGTLTVGTHAVTQSGSWTVTANAGTNLNTSALALESGGNLAAIATDMAAIEVLLTTIEGNQLADGHNVTIDNASIAVTASSLPLPTGAATSANQSTANSSLATIAGDTTSLDSKIATYTTADFDTGTGTSTVTINGIALPGSGGPVVGGTASNPIVVDLGTNNDVTVTGSVTANAGTNLNTSLLALESGGNLATIAGDTTSLDGKVTACDTGAVVISSSALPSGAATASNQSTIIGHVDGIETLLGTIDADTGSIATAASTIAGDTTSIDSKITACNTGAVVISSSALPSGAATAANQSTANGLLTTIDADTGSIATDASTIAGDTTSLDSKIAAYTTADLDTGTGTSTVTIVGIALPGSGGPVVGGTATNPVVVTPDDPIAVGTAGSAATDVLTVQGIASMTPILATLSGTNNIATVTTVTTCSTVTNLSQLGGQAIAMGTGTRSAGTQRVTIATDDVVPASQSGSWTVTANLSATDNAVLDSIELNTDKGTSHHRNIDANAETEIKGSAGTLHWVHAINLTDAIAYLHLYDQVAASVTPGTTTPTYTFPIPTPGTASQGGGFVLRVEQAFSTGITYVVTTTVDGSAGDPGTNGVMVNAGYT